MGENELVRRIRYEADMAARPGQYDRLVAIANEVAALREQMDALLRDESKWGHNIRREVLADLRAKVRLIPARAVRMEHEWSNDAGWVPTDKVIDTVPLADVLTLIEEVGQ